MSGPEQSLPRLRWRGLFAAPSAFFSLLGSAWVLAGTFVFYSQWTVWEGLAIIAVALFICGLPGILMEVWRTSPLWRAAFFWVLWMLGSSLFTAGREGSEAWFWGAAGLLLWLTLLHETGRDDRRSQWLGGMVVAAATLSALVSIVQAAWCDPGWHWGMRLGNRLVYGGWNQVCSGVTYAFAAVWALCLGPSLNQRRWIRGLLGLAHAILLFAALASLSRGALLVLLAGHGLALLLNWRAHGVGALRLLAVVALFHLIMPGLAQPNAQSPPETEVSRRFPRAIDSNPMREWTKRGSTGRFEMYEAVRQTLIEGGAGRWFFGLGLWSEPALWNERLPERERAPHPHSVLVATALHGGGIGLIGLFVVLGVGLVVAWRVARRGQWSTGLILAVAGLAGVVFDGQSLTTLDTLPRFEPLLVWTGLFLASGRASAANKSFLDRPSPRQ